MRIRSEEGALSLSSERCISHWVARFASLGVQARERELQAWRSRRLARDQTKGVETCANTPRLFPCAQDPDWAASYTACRTDARSCRVAAQCSGVQHAQHALTTTAFRRHMRLPQPEISCPDGRHDAVSSGRQCMWRPQFPWLMYWQWNQELTNYLMAIVPDPEHPVHKDGMSYRGCGGALYTDCY